MLLNPFRFGGSGGTLWTPAELSPGDWFDPATTATDDGGGLCSSWANAYGAGARNMIASGTERTSIIANAQNSLRALRWNATQTIMRLNGSTALTQNLGALWAFMVFKFTALDGAANDRCMFFTSIGTGTQPAIARFGFGTLAAGAANRIDTFHRRLDADSFTSSAGVTVPNTNYHMLMVMMDWTNGDASIILDGGTPVVNSTATSNGSTSNTASVENPNIGALHRLSPDSLIQLSRLELGEMVVKSGSIPAGGEIDKMFGYAAHRWALTSVLPGGHPYKTVAPYV
jgi:hypothetical protein